jgi:hypothetical protein
MNKVLNEFEKAKVENAELREERKILLENLGWTGMTDEEVTWIINHKEIERTYQLTLGDIRKLIDDEKNNKL